MSDAARRAAEKIEAWIRERWDIVEAKTGAPFTRAQWIEEAEQIIDAEFAREPETETVNLLRFLRGYIQFAPEPTRAELVIIERIDAAITRAGAAREPARMQSRQAIGLAALKAASDLIPEDSAVETVGHQDALSTIAKAFTLQPCGHLVTSQVERDGKTVCEQCELEAEIVGVVQDLRDVLGFANPPEMCRGPLCRTCEVLKRADALLAKLEGKEPSK